MAPQPVVIDARLGYRCEPSEEGEWIDYDGYCARVASFLSHKPHTRLLETLVADLAVMSFRMAGAGVADLVDVQAEDPAGHETRRRVARLDARRLSAVDGRGGAAVGASTSRCGSPMAPRSTDR
jgi:dihydroneopterin aldolase